MDIFRTPAPHLLNRLFVLHLLQKSALLTVPQADLLEVHPVGWSVATKPKIPYISLWEVVQTHISGTSIGQKMTSGGNTVGVSSSTTNTRTVKLCHWSN